MKSQFSMLTLLIDSLRQPEKDNDVYLQPLIDELKDLWNKEVRTFDSYKDNSFNMRVVLLWTINDFPTYGELFGCKTKGNFSCLCCGPNIDSLRLQNGKKHVYMVHRRWLPL